MAAAIIHYAVPIKLHAADVQVYYALFDFTTIICFLFCSTTELKKKMCFFLGFFRNKWEYNFTRLF